MAARHGAWILSDEVYRGAERDGKETATFWGSYDRLVVTGGLSKAYGLPGLRIGWVVGPAATAGELWGRKDYLTISPGALGPTGPGAHRAEARAHIFARTRGILAANYPMLEEWMRRRGRSSGSMRRGRAIAYLRYDGRWAPPEP